VERVNNKKKKKKLGCAFLKSKKQTKKQNKTKNNKSFEG